MKKVAVILSGSGVFDGSEIHESVLALHAIEKQGATWHCYAPNKNQANVVDHLTGDVMEEQSRNILVESARIARGNVKDLEDLNVEDYDALLVPGGFGAAKNFTDFANSGSECSIDPLIASVCHSFAEAKKPAGYVCIAPVIIPMVYDKGVKGTLGTHPEMVQAFTELGGEHVECSVGEVAFDQEHKVLSTPSYMLAENITQAALGIEKLVQTLVEIA